MSPSTACSWSEVAQPFRSNNLSFLLPSFSCPTPVWCQDRMSSHLSFPNSSIQFWESLIFYCLRGSGSLSLSPFLPGLSLLSEHWHKWSSSVCNAPQHCFHHLNVDLLLHPKVVFSCFSIHLMYSTFWNLLFNETYLQESSFIYLTYGKFFTSLKSTSIPCGQRTHNMAQSLWQAEFFSNAPENI